MEFPPPNDSVRECYDTTCCIAPGLEMKASDSLLSEQGVCREVAECSLGKCLSVLCGEYTQKGGRGNASLEGIFSLSRGL